MTAPAPDLVDLGVKLQEARDRTLRLIAPLSDSDLRRQHSSLMSPIIWDLGHIAHFEEVWLLENMDGAGSGAEGLRGIYDAFRHPRATRDRLPLPDRATCLDYLADVRRAVLRKMEGIDPRMEGIDPRADTPLLRRGYVFNMVLQHEYQHNETILQTLQLMDGEPYAGLAVIAEEAYDDIITGAERGGNRCRVAAGDGVERGDASVGPRAGRRGLEADAPAAIGTGPEMDSAEAKRAPDAGGRAMDMVRFPGGNVFIGTDDRSRAYDNERPRTRLRVEPFRIDRHPVDNAALIDFIAAGGYRTDAHWSEAGLAWRTAERATARSSGSAGTERGGPGRSGARLRSIRRCRCATSPGTRPTPSRAGPGSACPRRPSGKSPPPGIRPGIKPAATPGATSPPRPLWPTWTPHASARPLRAAIPGTCRRSAATG